MSTAIFTDNNTSSSAFPHTDVPNKTESELLKGASLARALVENISRVGASGYSDEIMVDGERWIVSIARRSII